MCNFGGLGQFRGMRVKDFNFPRKICRIFYTSEGELLSAARDFTERVCCDPF